MATKKNKKLDSKKAENETTVLELTQTLATVTVEKTKVEKALEERKNEVESLRQRLQETEDELGQIKTEKSALWTELVSGRERISDLEEKLKAAEANNATLLETITEQAEEISSLKAELGRPSEIPRLPPPLPVKSAAPKPAEEEAPPTAEKKPSTGDDDAFDEGVQSPVAPCPYLSFVPLQDDPRSRHKKGKDSEGTKSKKSTIEASKKSSDQSPPSVETGKEERGQVEQASVTEDEQKEKEATAVDDGEVEGEATTVAEQQDQEQDHTEEKLDSAVPLPEFDLVKPLHKLDSRAALHKSQVGGQIKRKKPSRDHLRQMGSSSNLLDSIPDEQMKEPSPPAMTEEEPATKEGEEKEKEKEKESEPSTKQQSTAVEAPSPTAAPVQPPKPKPRAAPRKRNPDPTSPTSESSKPHAVPRQKSEAKELSPLPPDGEKSSGERVIDNDSEQKTEESQSTVGAQSSPSIQRKEASKAPHSPKHPPSPKKEHGSHENEDHTPKPLPRGHGKAGKEEEPSSSDDKMAELMKKDPSELTVKEKALLAQRTVGALGHDKTKLPPPVPRKPKPGQGGGGEGEHSETGSDHERGRSQSIDEKESRPSPSHGRRKLPPGAVNIMAGLAASAAERGRCNTVSTTEPGARERNSLERNAALQDHLPEHGASQDGIEHIDHSTKPLPRVPPKRPPLPMQKKPSNEVPSRADDSVDGVESDSSPSLERKVNDVDDETPAQDKSHDQSHDREEEDEVDLNTILTWNPNVVGLWLESVGLGQYREAFAGVQGFMLIDMDGHRLKGLGMTSHDDRNSFKKEVKNLKPYADKHKKLLEKQRKEEKKNAKKKKK